MKPTNRVEEESDFVVTGTRRARCAPERVMELILAPGTWPHWQPEIESTTGPTRLVNGDRVEGRARMLGFSVHGRSDATSVEADHFEEDAVVGVRMRVRYEVRSDGDRTAVSARMVAELPRGALGRIVGLLLRMRLRGMQRLALERLVSQAEAESAS